MTRTAAVPGTVTDPVGDTDTGTTRAAAWPRAASAVGHRWPTWLALAWSAISLWDVGDGLEYVFLLLLAAAGYLFMALDDRPRATWPVLFALVATVVILRLLDIDPVRALAVVAVALVVVGLIGGQLRRPGLYMLQSPAANKIVARSFAEWPGVLDLILGLAILILVR